MLLAGSVRRGGAFGEFAGQHFPRRIAVDRLGVACVQWAGGDQLIHARRLGGPHPGLRGEDARPGHRGGRPVGIHHGDYRLADAQAGQQCG